MTNQNTPAPANQLSDEYVNVVIQQHGYRSPETVIARLNQWIGLHGGENSVTLLMYEAHKALSRLRAPIADGARDDIAAGLQDSAYCAGLQRGFMLGDHGDNEGFRQALESRDGYVKTIKDASAALASAPVAGEAVSWANWKVGTKSYVPYRTREEAQAYVNRSAIAATQEGPYQVVALIPAAAQASEMINAKVDLYTVGAVLGHKSAASTKRYAHLATDAMKTALGQIGKKSPDKRKARVA